MNPRIIPKIIGVAGASGSGKTTLADKIMTELGKDNCLLIKIDDYYRPQDHLTMDERVKTDYDDPKSIDFPRFMADLTKLQNGEAVYIPEYDFVKHTRKEFDYNTAQLTSPKKYIVIEGIFALHEDLREFLDAKIYVKADLDFCLLRRIKRDVAERNRTVADVITQWETTVKPGFTKFVEPTKAFSDITAKNNLPGVNFDMVEIMGLVNTKLGALINFEGRRKINLFAIDTQQLPVTVVDSPVRTLLTNT